MTARLKLHPSERDVYLHVDANGELLTARGSGRVEPAKLSDLFLAAGDTPEHGVTLRIVSSRSNLTLIGEAYKQAEYAGARVLLASPSLCPAPIQLAKGQESLDYVRMVSPVSASCGGWHVLTKEVFASYAIAMAPVSERVPLLMKHPAWPAWSYAQIRSADHFCELIETILDPRRFVDPNHPDRWSKLRRYLGLDKKDPPLDEDLDNELEDTGVRYLIAWAAWSDMELNPDFFPFMPVQEHREVKKEPHAISRAHLYRTRRFVDFIRLTWLDSLSPKQLFVPKHFFRTDYAVSRFLERLSN